LPISCHNRHCPKCQGAAAREWLAEREAELLPVPYFHVVYTLPAPISDIAYTNKAVIYDLLFRASAETTLKIAATRRHLGARIGFMSVLHTWGSALTHHPACAYGRAGRWSVGGWLKVDRVPTGVLSVRRGSQRPAASCETRGENRTHLDAESDPFRRSRKA
jgi:Transposase zinc-binding domain